MSDTTETIRPEMVAKINAEPGSRAYLEQQHGSGLNHKRTATRLRSAWAHGSTCGRAKAIRWGPRKPDLPARSTLLHWMARGIITLLKHRSAELRLGGPVLHFL